MPSAETIPFQAETRRLLDLVIHSLYTHPEIFLRELISNASDALDRLRLAALTDDSLAVDASDLRIRLEPDGDKRILRVSDNGIGMTREEVIENLGTIARSGTRGFLEALAESEEKPTDLFSGLIGQFGVGFYSSFMVADEVEVETRGVGQAKGTRWRSRGDGEYTVEEIDKPRHGTTVILHLKDADTVADQDFATEPVLRTLVRRYSDFIEYPIEMEVGDEDVVLNSRKPLWTRPKNEIEDDEYAEFYRHLSHDWNEPLETIHFRAEGATEYIALLYVPRERPLDIFDPGQAESRIHLYVKRVFVMADCEDLVPSWLRFVRGVVDATDLPLNVSRETLQHDRRMVQIRKRLTRKVLDALAAMLADRREDYTVFWRAFGPVLKEGLYHDDEMREKIAGLVLASGTAGDEPCTLGEYVERMPVAQTEIYVLVAPDLDTARRSPHLEAFEEREREVLFLTDPVDEFVLARLTEFQGKRIRRIDRGEIDLGDDDEKKQERETREEELGPVLEAIRKELAEHVEEVRFSSRLTESPACLVAGEHDMSRPMRQMLRQAGQDVPEPKRSLELNANHPLITRLKELAADDADHARFAEGCELLLGTALVAEGEQPPDPVRFTRLVTEMMVAQG